MNHKKKLLWCAIFCIMTGGLPAASISKPKPVTKAQVGALYHALRFAMSASLGFFALTQASYHFGSFMAGGWLDNQFRDTLGYKQGIRFGVGIAGTMMLLLMVSCLDHFGYYNLDNNIAELSETVSTVDGTAQAPVRRIPIDPEA